MDIPKKKKKIMIASNASHAKTGFGRHMRTLLTELYKLDKYDLVEYSIWSTRFTGPETYKTPWKSYGCIYDSDADIYPIQNNPHLIHMMHIGEALINEVVEQEKPDFVILIDDIWKIDWVLNKPWWNKIPSVIWTPIDSSPILPVFIDNKDKLKNLWVKAEFAKRELKKHDIDSEFIPLLTDHSDFKKLDNRKDIRKAAGLDDNFVIGFIARNQVRKLFVTLLKEFKDFKAKTGAPAKLLFHTNFSEISAPNGQIVGWNIPQAIQNLGIDANDVLTTYLCKNCKGIQIIPFHGPELNCGRCNTEKSLVQPNISFGVTEQELNLIYNLMDCYIHPATSGGFEAPILEAMLAEIPSATCNYSFGETFINSGYCHNIDHQIVEEISTLFDKSQPKTGEICRILTDIYENPEKNKEIAKLGCEWAKETFEVSHWINKIAEMVDSSTHDYDFDFSDTKNVDYKGNLELDNSAFIIDLYKKVLKIEIAEDNDDCKKYLERLSRGEPKQSVYHEILNIARQYNESRQQVGIEHFIKESPKKKLAYIMPESFGDCFISLSILEGLLVNYPVEEWDHYVVTRPQYFQIFDHLNYLAGFIPYKEGMDNFKTMEGTSHHQGFVDVCLQPYILTQRNCCYHHGGKDIDILQINVEKTI